MGKQQYTMRFNLDKCKVILRGVAKRKKQIEEYWSENTVWRLTMDYYGREFLLHDSEVKPK